MIRVWHIPGYLGNASLYEAGKKVKPAGGRGAVPNTCENDALSTTDTRVRIAQFYPFLPFSRRVMRAESHRKRMIQFALGAVLSPSSNVTKPPFRLRFFIALKVCGKDVLDALIPAVPDIRHILMQPVERAAGEIDSGHCCFARGLVGALTQEARLG
jgi:hypothetical protein